MDGRGRVRKASIMAAAALVVAGFAPAEAGELTCRGDITSIQGEGMVSRTHRFEVSDITGPDVTAVLEKARKIAVERQNIAARKNPGGNFRPTSDVNLQCVQGGEKTSLHRTIRTAR